MSVIAQGLAACHRERKSFAGAWGLMETDSVSRAFEPVNRAIEPGPQFTAKRIACAHS